jgi:hypothetical protein
MNDVHLPDDLASIERLLTLSSLGHPSEKLRHRVQQSIHIGKENAWPDKEIVSTTSWSFFVGLAATIAVWANLSFSALNQGVSLAAPPPNQDIDRQAELLRELAPSLSKDDARRQLVVLGVGLRWTEQRFRQAKIQSARTRKE